MPEAPEVDLDQEKDEVSQETTDELTIEQSITDKVGVTLEIDKSDQGDKAAIVGITIHFDSLENRASTGCSGGFRSSPGLTGDRRTWRAANLKEHDHEQPRRHC
jgi:hypothetical protein